MEAEFTGREIAIFADVHGLLEPLEAILLDCKEQGITEIYSLGDDIGEGPNSKEVIDLLIKNNVKGINGNAEDYIAIGIEPFSDYIKGERALEQERIKSALTSEQIDYLKSRKHSIDLIVGGKRIGLCHFVNDVRFDYKRFSTWSYQKNLKISEEEAIKQFYEQNNQIQKEIIESHIIDNKPENKGYLSAFTEPLFEGKMVNEYDEIIQGHVHFPSEVKDEYAHIRTIRSAGMAYGIDDQIDEAAYIVIKETTLGYVIEERRVKYDRDKMIASIESLDLPNKDKLLKFTSKSDVITPRR